MDKIMEKSEYEKRIAQLESINDQLTAEFNHLNVLLKKLGFEEGIKTLKDAATELLQKESSKEHPGKKKIGEEENPS